MRLLFLSNFYPPVHGGGYAQLCYEVARTLEARGHTVAVLTSNYQRAQAPVHESNIYRLFHLESNLFYYRPVEFLLRWKKHQRENSLSLLLIVNKFEPEVIVIWGMWMLSMVLPALCERLLPSRVVYYLAGHWPAVEDIHATYWRRPAQRWFMRRPKQLLNKVVSPMLASKGTPVLKFEHALCVSAALRDVLIARGLPLKCATVVHNGIRVEQFLNDNWSKDNRFHGGNLRLLYAGQLAHHKGVHTAIEALARLVREQELDHVNLTILGAGHPDYEASLYTAVDREGLGNHVTFWDKVPREEMPLLLQQFDVLLFPSIYEEPLARIVQEAMAAGLVVVGTTTGGTTEILNDDKNGLVFAPEDAAGLAEQIARLAANPNLCRQLADAGRQTVQEKFTIDRMVTDVENYLQGVIQSAHSISH